MYRQHSIFERYTMLSMFQRREHRVLKEATIKEKNMLPLGSILFSFKSSSYENRK